MKLPTLSAPQRESAIGAMALLVIVLGLLGWSRADAWWTAKQAVITADIARRDHAVAIAKAEIRERDRRLALLQQHDSSLAKSIVKMSRAKDSIAANYADAKRALDADAAMHAGLVPIAAVHLVEAKADSNIASCEQISRGKDLRISELQEQVANVTASKSEQATIITQQDSTRKEVIELLRPPWWKRSISWVGDHAVTLVVGAGTALAVEHVVRK